MSSDPRRRLTERSRLDGPPGWADSLLAGRSRADKEADQDAMHRVMILGLAVVGTVLIQTAKLSTPRSRPDLLHPGPVHINRARMTR
jgi:hypothetical protein